MAKDPETPKASPKRGAIPTPPDVLAAAKRYVPPEDSEDNDPARPNDDDQNIEPLDPSKKGSD